MEWGGGLKNMVQKTTNKVLFVQSILSYPQQNNRGAGRVKIKLFSQN